MMQPQTAMILAAGFGKRMRPITNNIPKPLVEVAGRTMIDRALDRLVEAGVKKAVINISYKAEMLEAHLAGRRDIMVVFSYEDVPLETGGGIKKALSCIAEDIFFVTNSDAIWLDGEIPALTQLCEAYESAKNIDSAMLLIPTDKAHGYSGEGDFFTGSNGQMKFRKAAEHAPYVFGGIQLMHRRLVSGVEKDSFALSEIYRSKADANGWLQSLAGVPYNGTWIHVGEPAAITMAEKIIERQKNG